MSKNLETILSVLAVACLTMLIIGKIFNFWNIGSDFMDKAEKKATNMATSFDEADYTKYDGVVVTGSDVKSFIKNQIDQEAEICIEVITPKGSTTYLYTDATLATKSTANIASTASKKNAAYINPTAYFLGACTRDATKAITYMSFTQQ